MRYLFIYQDNGKDEAIIDTVTASVIFKDGDGKTLCVSADGAAVGMVSTYEEIAAKVINSGDYL